METIMKKKWSEKYSLKPALAGAGIGIGAIGLLHLLFTTGAKFMFMFTGDSLWKDDSFLQYLKFFLSMHTDNNGVNAYNAASLALIAMTAYVNTRLSKKEKLKQKIH